MAAPQRHPDLDVENHHNNFALLFLSEKFEIMQHISPICLPQPDSPPAASEYCVSHGWGKDKFGASGRSVSQSVRGALGALRAVSSWHKRACFSNIL